MSEDIVVIGAGAAGLTAAIELAKSGLRVTILEARDRIGGRIFTTIDPSTKIPVELGAEFVHGKPPEIWDIIRDYKLKTIERDGDQWCFRHGQLCPCDFFAERDDVFKYMNDKSPDQTFTQYLKTCCPDASDEAKRWVLSYVQGFHAADPGKVSVHSLVKSNEAEEKIEGDRAFHIAGGYAALMNVLEREIQRHGVTLCLNTPLKQVSWAERQVRLAAGGRTLFADKAVITLPLSVLQSGDVQFERALPRQKREALDNLEMGHVIRVTLVFRERFWKDLRPPGSEKTLANLSFLFSQDQWFPTWWTQILEESPVITGWAPFPSADLLSGKPEKFVVDKCLDSLAKILDTKTAQVVSLLRAAYTHDWQSDPWSRGAYSYVKAGGQSAERDLGQPLDGRLFFAGEATDFEGNNGTVNGAIASGKRVAREVLGSPN